MTIKVNGRTLPPQAIEYELQRLVRFYSGHLSETELRAQMDALRQKAKEQAIGGLLLMQRARELDLQPAPEQVEERFQQLIANCGGREKFQELIQRQKLAEELLRESIAEGCRVDLLVAKITAGVPEPTEEDLRAHYEAHRAEYQKPEQARAQHILIRPHSEAPADREVALSRLQELRRQLETGANFADLAAAHSDCPSGKRAGGSLGWIARGTMVPEFDGALFALRDGEVSEPVQTTLGWHLIARTATEPAGPAEYDEVREKIRDFLRHVRRGEAIAAYVAELKEKAIIEES